MKLCAKILAFFLSFLSKNVIIAFGSSKTVDLMIFHDGENGFFPFPQQQLNDSIWKYAAQFETILNDWILSMSYVDTNFINHSHHVLAEGNSKFKIQRFFIKLISAV